MTPGGMHSEFRCAGKYAMALARGYVMARHRLALVCISKSTKSFLRITQEETLSFVVGGRGFENKI